MNMPIFTFRCTSETCEHQFDELRGFNDTTEVKCPKCGNTEVERVYKSIKVDLNFKGSYNSTRTSR